MKIDILFEDLIVSLAGILKPPEDAEVCSGTVIPATLGGLGINAVFKGLYDELITFLI